MDDSCRFVSVFFSLFLLSQMPAPSTTAAIGRVEAVAGSSSTGGRWRQPCAGETPSEHDPSHEALTAPNADHFAELSRKVTGLKEPINTLKNRYVVARFGNASYAERSIDLSSPSTIAPKWNLTNTNDSEKLKLCYENLARLAVLTNLTRQGELAAEVADQFAGDFEELEQHAVRGLYVIMCDLSTVMTDLGVELMSAETEAQVEAISFPTPSSEAQRHSRDYYVLRLLEISADKLTAIFDHFVGQLSPRESRQ